MVIDTQTSPNLERSIANVSRDLSDSLRLILEALPGPSRRPNDVQRTLGIKKDVASRVVRASKEQDPLASALLLPGPAALRQLLIQARACGIDESILQDAEVALSGFEALIRDELGDRVTFDSVVSDMLPEAREKHELFTKQLIYRGMSHVKGASANVMLNSAFISPGKSSDVLDGTWLLGWFGLRRLRPRARVHFTTGRIGSKKEVGGSVQLSGEPIADPHDVFIESFCTQPMENIEIQERDKNLHYILGGNGVGKSSAMNIVLGNYTAGCLPALPVESGPNLRGPTMEITTPCKMAVLDVFVHADVFPDTDPELRVYDTTVNGVANMNDPLRDNDRLDVIEKVEFMGFGLSGVRASDVPDYPEMVQHVMRARELDPDQMRLYRCRSRYPIYGAQFSFAFDPSPIT